MIELRCVMLRLYGSNKRRNIASTSGLADDTEVQCTVQRAPEGSYLGVSVHHSFQKKKRQVALIVPRATRSGASAHTGRDSTWHVKEFQDIFFIDLELLPTQTRTGQTSDPVIFIVFHSTFISVMLN